MSERERGKTLIVILVFLTTSALAITPTDDTFVDEFNPGIVNGSSVVLIVRNINLNPGELDSLLKFDLTSIPAAATIKSATLKLYYFHWSDVNPTGRLLNIYRITQDWSESIATWSNRPAFNSTSIDTLTMPGSYGWVQWDVTSSARDFHDGTYPNYGWQIMDVGTFNQAMIYFHSNNYNSDTSLRPKLEITTNIIYVDENAAGANDGLSWTDAYNYLQDALSAAGSGDEIWVADGVYRPDMGGGKIPNDVNETFQLINSVELYGGFAGGETSLEQRDWENNITILSGDIGIADNNSDNSYHVVTGSSTDSTALIDGFTITQGNANGIGSNGDGGGMYTYQGSPTVRNCIFTLNHALDDGGGMYNYYQCDPDVINCTFSNNTAQSGGGIANYYSSSPAIVNCFFNDNYATSGGGAVFNEGLSKPVLLNCVIVDNSAGGDGGGISNEGGSHDDAWPTLINCSVSNNTAAWGGGMYTDNNEEEDDPIVTNCIFWGNTAGGGTVTEQQIDGDNTIVTYSCIQDSDPNDGSIPFGGAANNNIDDNPLFKNVISNNLRLSGDSPCIEVGSNAAVPADTLDIDGDGNTSEPTPLDLDERLRFWDGNCDGTDTVDMGAYELIWVYLGDLDSDCDVDLKDFAVFSSNWLAGK